MRHLARLTAIVLAFSAGLLMSAAFAAQPNQTVTKCGAPIKSVVKTNRTPDLGTNSTTFVPLEGAHVTVQVPSGTERCIKVRLSAVTSCGGAAQDFCRLTVRDNGAPLNPVQIVTFDSNKPTNSTSSFEWVERVGSGTHTIRVRIRVDDPQTSFLFSGYTLDVELTE